MWEQRYGFPEPERTAVRLPALHRGRRRGAAARRSPTASAACRCPPRSSARARRAAPTDRPSIFARGRGADDGARPQVLRKRTLLALSRAIEDETLARAAAPGRRSAPSSASATTARSSTATGAGAHRRRRASCSPTSPRVARPRDGAPVEIPIARRRRAGQRVGGRRRRARATRACLLAWEQPGVTEPGGPTTATAASRRSGRSTPRATRRAAQVAARLAAPRRPALGAAPRGAARPTARWRSRSPRPR